MIVGSKRSFVTHCNALYACNSTMQKTRFKTCWRNTTAVQYGLGTQQVQRPTVEPENIMKTSTYFKAITLATVLGAALSASVLAQNGPGAGPGAGMGAGPGAGMGAGQMAPAGRGMRGMRFNQSNTPGWTLMTAQERTAQQNQLREVKTYEECVQVQAEHRTTMEVRAKEKGVTLRAPRQNVCDVAKARGFIK